MFKTSSLGKLNLKKPLFFLSFYLVLLEKLAQDVVGYQSAC